MGNWIYPFSDNNFGGFDVKRNSGQRRANHVWTPVNSSYSLVFDEEFNGSSIDTSRWFIHNSGTFNNVPVLSANVSVASSTLICTLTSPYTSPTGVFMHSTGSTENFSIGPSVGGNVYVEGRCKMPTTPCPGLWPAFWMNAAGTYPEIDILEWAGSRPSHMDITYHNPNDQLANPTGTLGYGFSDEQTLAVDLSLGYHIYGTLWTTTDVTFYIDGVQYWTVHNGDSLTGPWGTATVNVSSAAMAIQFNNGAGGLGSNTLDATTTLPGLFKTDYVHVYKQGGTPVTPQANYGGPGSTLGPTT